MAIIQAPQEHQALFQWLARRAEQEQAKEQLKLRKDAFKLEQEEHAFRMQQAQAQQEAAASLLPLLASAAQQMGVEMPQFTPETAGAAMPQLAQTLQVLSGLRSEGAQTRLADVQGDVAEATAPAVIAEANLQPAMAEAQLELTEAQIDQAKANVLRTGAEIDEIRVATRGRELQNTYQRLVNERDPQRVNQARLLFETGAVTWGQARDAAGLGESDLIPDNTVYVDPNAAAGGANAETLKNLGFAQMMSVSHGIINSLSESGVRLGFLPSLQRQSKSATFDALVNMVAGTDQERLVNAQRMFGDAYRFSLSGQQSSDREALRMLNAIAEQVGDSEETIAQKRALREVMINVTRAKAGGGMDPIQGARMGLAAAKNTGNPETIKVFEDILEETIAAQAGGTGAGVTPPSNAPTDPSNVTGRLQGLDDLINLGLMGPLSGGGSN